MAAAPEMPHLTTAVIVEENQRILMVNEIDNGIIGWNQPAGHVEPGESLLDAARRETLEETQYQVRLTALVGIYQSAPHHRHSLFARLLHSRSARMG